MKFVPASATSHMLFPLTEILFSPLFKKYLNLKITSLEVKEVSGIVAGIVAGIEVKGIVAQPCPTLCHPMDCNPPGFSVHGNLQARILEWVAIPFSRGSSQTRDRTQVSGIAGRFFTI